MMEDPEAPPPSYESLFGQIKNVKAQSGGDKKKMAFGVFGVLTGSVIYLIILCVFLALPVSSIVMGSLYLHDCPAQRYIPIYLIVFGVFAIVQNLFNIFKNCKQRRDKGTNAEEEQSAKPNPFEGVLNCFLFAWFICGNVWVYGLKDWSRDSTQSNFCDPTLYYYAFWVITASYIMMGVCCCGAIIFSICLCCCATCSE